jgi:HEAT repeat protein
LSKLAKKGNTQARVETLIDDLMKDCIDGQSLALQRGAAYGISAIVKGSGIASLKKYDIVKRLEEACTSGSPSNKEGSLFAIELCCSRLGILFEPYVITLLPALLKAFSDSNDHVRSAADKTVGLIMSNLSGHGVKLVMPAVLEAFDEPEWRTRIASIKMLGSMSHCAPKQLASCLPKVVPKLTEAFSDTHPKVKKSAEDALEDLCRVIKNPEVSSISTTLLKALTDPANGTVRALEALISTEFLHAIDAPSLSVIIPVVHRGLRDRLATTKRYAALISGNICTMVNDPRDFVPYLPTLIPDLKSTLIDPIPDVRSISAKSLGSLTRGLGEATFPDLRPWLIETLTSEGGSSVERSGAAQGLTEVLVASGAQLTETVMRNEILPLKSHPKAGTREGVLWVLTFLPSSLGQAYSSLIDESLPALLSGLADDNETVREVALRAGRVLVRSNGKAHKDKILPALEQGLSNEDYRIRVSSLTLLGDLLSMLGGTKVSKGSVDTQDDIRQAERAQAQIALVLGNETRKRVLSSLYLARSDTAAIVRQSAVQVWKTVVSVTPRTLREILSELVDQVVSALASGDPDRTTVAGRCLGDIVQKLGDQVLPEIIPVLRDSLYKGDEYTRQGVCVGLAEVIACSSKEQIIKFLEILVKVVRDALCDDSPEVRKMAADCFQSLYQTVGPRTLEEIVPSLLVDMESNNDVSKTRALNGMAGILSVRSRELLPFIIPRLLKSPISVSHADGLASISSVTAETIHFHFNAIVPTLISEGSSFYDQDLSEEEKTREESIRRCSRAICHNVDSVGVNWLISEIASKCTSDKVSVRKESCWWFQVVAEESELICFVFDCLPCLKQHRPVFLNEEKTLPLYGSCH